MDRLSRYYPPGSSKAPLNIALWGGSVLLLVVWYGFVVGNGAVWQANAGQTLPALAQAIKPWMKVSFLILAGSTLACAAGYYQYFYQGSQSIYVMRRLRSCWELHVRCWTLPVLGVVIVCGFALVTYGICAVTYLLLAPEGMVSAQTMGLLGRYVP